MKANVLDEIIRKHLKGQTNTPENIIFRKDRIYQSLETKITERSNKRWQMLVAILILMISSSGYWHYEQQKTISNQNTILNYQQEQIVSITKETSKQKAVQISLSDSLKLIQTQVNNQVKLVRLTPLPKIIVNQPIVFKNTNETEHIIIRYITQYKTLKKEETKLPELDLPVVYESENLASTTMETTGSSKFSKKISKLFNN